MERVLHGFGHIMTCGVCNHILEDVLYAIRDCLTARNIWNLLIPSDRLDRFYYENL